MYVDGLRKLITKTRLCKYIENFATKTWKLSGKNSDIFHISAQKIDCGYSLEPPRRKYSDKRTDIFHISVQNIDLIYVFEQK